MKRIIFIWTLFLSCIFIIQLNSMPTRIVVGYHSDFSPYFSEKNGRLVGIFPEMINKAAEIMGIKVQYKKFPWKRMVYMAKIGEVDAIMPIYKTEERDEFLLFPDQGIALGEKLFFTLKKSKIEFTGDLHNMKLHTIGIVNECSYGERFDHADYLQKDESNSNEALVEKLLSGRFQVGVGPEEVIRFYARNLGMEERIHFIQPPLMRGILYVGFSKTKVTKGFVKKFSSAVAELTNNGTHQKILEKFGYGDDMAFFREIIIGGDKEDYPPYSYWEKGKMKGVCPEIINRAAEFIGVKVRYKAIQWNDHIRLVKNKEIDAVMPLFKTKEREANLYFPGNGLVAEKNYFFTLKNGGIRYFGNPEDWKEIAVGDVGGYRYGEKFDSESKVNTKEYPTNQALVQAVGKGKIKVGIGNDRVIKYFARQLGIADKIEFLKPALPEEFLYLAFSRSEGKGYEKLALSFSDAINTLKKSDEYHKILGYHGLEKRTLVLAANNWPSYYAENLSNNGPIAEIITQAFARVDYQVKIDFIPWPNLLEKVKKGTYDGGFAAYHTPGRERDYYFSDSLLKTGPMVFYKRIDQNIIYSSLEDLKNYRIGVERDFAYPRDFSNAPGLQCIEANSAEANIYHLLQGNLDLIIIDKLYAQHILSKMSTDVVNRLEPLDLFPGKEKESAFQDIYLIISKKSKNGRQVIIDFNYGLMQMKDDETLAQILKKHGIYNEIFNK